MTTHQSEMDLFAPADVERYRTEWRAVQSGFVDDPEAAVRNADQLVERLVQSVTSMLAKHRDELGTGNGNGERTEQLRQALRHYRSLFEQLTGTQPATATTPPQAAAPPAAEPEPVADETVTTTRPTPVPVSAESGDELVEHDVDRADAD